MTDQEITLIIDETGERKKGETTDYVKRQYIGNLGKIENEIVAVTAYELLEGITFPFIFEADGVTTPSGKLYQSQHHHSLYHRQHQQNSRQRKHHHTANTVRFIANPYIIAAGEAFAAKPVPIQSKELSMMSKLQALDKEATVRFTVDMSETLHRQKGENENE